MDPNEAMIACRALEVRYLAALAPDAGTTEMARLRGEIIAWREGSRVCTLEIAKLRAERAAIATLIDRLCTEADRLYMEGKQELPGPKLRALGEGQG